MEKKRVKCVGHEIIPTDPIYYAKFSNLKQYRHFTINKVIFNIGDFVVIEKSKRPPPIDVNGFSPKIAQIFRVFKSETSVFALVQWFILAKHCPEQLLHNFPDAYPPLDRKKEILCDRRYIKRHGRIEIGDILNFTSVAEIPRDANPRSSGDDKNVIYVTRFGIKESSNGIRLVKFEELPSEEHNKKQQIPEPKKPNKAAIKSAPQNLKPCLELKFVKHEAKTVANLKLKVPVNAPAIKPLKSSCQAKPLSAETESSPEIRPLKSKRLEKTPPLPFESSPEIRRLKSIPNSPLQSDSISGSSEFVPSQSSTEESEAEILEPELPQRETRQKRKLFNSESQNIPIISQPVLRNSQRSKPKESLETDKMKPTAWQGNGNILDEPGPSESVKVSPRKCRKESWSSKIITRSPEKSPVRMKLVKCNPDESLIKKLNFEEQQRNEKLEKRRRERPVMTIMEDTPDSYNTPADYVFPNSKRHVNKGWLAKATIVNDDDSDFSIDELKQKDPKQKSMKEFITITESIPSHKNKFQGKFKPNLLIDNNIQVVNLEEDETRKTRQSVSKLAQLSHKTDSNGHISKDSVSSNSIISVSEDEAVGVKRTRFSLVSNDKARLNMTQNNAGSKEERRTRASIAANEHTRPSLSQNDTEKREERKTRSSLAPNNVAVLNFDQNNKESSEEGKSRSSLAPNEHTRTNITKNNTTNNEERRTRISFAQNNSTTLETSRKKPEISPRKENTEENQCITHHSKNYDSNGRVKLFKKPDLNSSSSTISSYLVPFDSSTPVLGVKHVRRQPSGSSDYSPDLPVTKPSKCKTKTNYTIVEDSFEDLNSSKVRKFFKSPVKADVTIISARMISPMKNKAIRPSPVKNNAKSTQSPGKSNTKSIQSPGKKLDLFFEEEQELLQKKSPYKDARFFISIDKNFKKPVTKKKAAMFEDSDSESSPQVEKTREQPARQSTQPEQPNKQPKQHASQSGHSEQSDRQPATQQEQNKNDRQFKQPEQSTRQLAESDEDLNTPDDAPTQSNVPSLQPVIKLCKMSKSLIEQYTYPKSNSQTSASSEEVISTPGVRLSCKITSDSTETSDDENPFPKSLRNELKCTKIVSHIATNAKPTTESAKRVLSMLSDDNINEHNFRSITLVSPNTRPTPETAKRVLNMASHDEEMHPVLKLFDKNIALRGSPAKSILTPEYVTPEIASPGKSPRKRTKSRSISEGVKSSDSGNTINSLQSVSCETLNSGNQSSNSEYLSTEMSPREDLISEDESFDKKRFDGSPHVIDASDSESEPTQKQKSADKLRALRSRVAEKMKNVDIEVDTSEKISSSKSQSLESNVVSSFKLKLHEKSKQTVGKTLLKLQEKEKSPSKLQEKNSQQGTERKFSFRNGLSQESQNKSLSQSSLNSQSKSSLQKQTMSSPSGQKSNSSHSFQSCVESQSQSPINLQHGVTRSTQTVLKSKPPRQPSVSYVDLSSDSSEEEEVCHNTKSSPLKSQAESFIKKRTSTLDLAQGPVRQSPRKSVCDAQNEPSTSAVIHSPRHSPRVTALHKPETSSKPVINKALENLRQQKTDNSTPEVNDEEFMFLFNTPDPNIEPKSPLKLQDCDISEEDANDITFCVFETQDVSFSKKSPVKITKKKSIYEEAINDVQDFFMNTPLEVSPTRKSPRKVLNSPLKVSLTRKSPRKLPNMNEIEDGTKYQAIPSVVMSSKTPQKNVPKREKTPDLPVADRLSPRKLQNEEKISPNLRNTPRKTQNEDKTSPNLRNTPKKTQDEDKTSETSPNVRHSPRKLQYEDKWHKTSPNVRHSPRKLEMEPEQLSDRQSPRKYLDQSCNSLDASLHRIVLNLNKTQSSSSSSSSSRRKQQISSRNASEDVIPEKKEAEKRKRGRPSKGTEVSPPKKLKCGSDDNATTEDIIISLSSQGYQKCLSKHEISQHILDDDDDDGETFFDVKVPLNDKKIPTLQRKSSPFPTKQHELNLKLDFKGYAKSRREKKKLEFQQAEDLIDSLKRRASIALGGVEPKVPPLKIQKSKILENVSPSCVEKNKVKSSSSRLGTKSSNADIEGEETPTKKKNSQAYTPQRGTPKTQVSTPSCDKTPKRKMDTPSHQVSTPKHETPSNCETPKSRGRGRPRLSVTPSKTRGRGRPKTPKSSSKQRGRPSLAKSPTSAKKVKTKRVRGEVEIEEQEMPGRETQMNIIQTFVVSKIVDRGGGCMYISGVPGTGKTASVTQVVRRLMQLKADDDLPDFKLIQVSGMELTQPQQVFSRMVNSLFGLKMSSSLAQTKLETYFKNKDKNRPPTILIIDELDMLCTRRQDVVYSLFDWPAQSKARLIVLAIANTMDLPERLLKGKVTSRLGLTRITFQPYSFAQLQKIVAVKLYNADMFDSDAVQLVARKVASVSGDARRALDICRRASELVDTDNGESVEIKHVMLALSEMLDSPIIETVRNCSPLMKYFLKCLVGEMRRTGLEESTFEDVYNVFTSGAYFNDIEKCSMSQIADVCAQLSAMRLILAEDDRGNIKQRLKLNVSSDELYYALEERKN